MFDISHGLEKTGNSYFYVSCGTGFWGIPMRLGTRSDIVIFDIE
jgi:predicted MPP superfamily phosphohydrolase